MKKKKRNRGGGIPDWAWYITWGIMLAAIAGPELLKFLAKMIGAASLPVLRR